MLAAAIRLPPAFDEVYYWTWASDLGWSYFDHPPAIAWAIAAARAVFGPGVLALRALSLGCCGIVATASVASARALRPDVGDLALLTLAGSMMFVVGYLPATPDVLQGAQLALAAYALIRAPRSRAMVVAAAALLVGGAIVKHSSALILCGATAVILVRRPRTFASPWPWIGAAIGAAVLVPWLYADLGGSTAFQAARVFDGRATRVLLAVPLTLGAMLLTLGAPFTVGMIAATRRSASTVEAALLGGAWALVLGCVIAAGLGTGEINWVMPALVFALPAVVARVAGSRHVRVYTIVTAVTATVWMVGLAHVVEPFLPLAPSKDRTLRSAGFERIAAEADAVAEQYGAPTIVARRYQVASMMRFFLADRRPVHELGTSRKSQYDRWPRPPLAPGDRAVAVLPPGPLPAGMRALDAGRVVEQARSGRTLGAYQVTPVEITPGFNRD